jgi:hypothetical protein
MSISDRDPSGGATCFFSFFGEGGDGIAAPLCVDWLMIEIY